MSHHLQDQFFTLTPDRVLDAVERALGARATGRTLTLNSMENRVYEIELEDETRVVSKFYRPGRWSRETILEEHAFAAELVEHEVPAVPPRTLVGGSTLASTEDGILFAVFSKVRGRIVQELDDARLTMIGGFARLHNIGATKTAPGRLTLTADALGTTARAARAERTASRAVALALRRSRSGDVAKTGLVCARAVAAYPWRLPLGNM